MFRFIRSNFHIISFCSSAGFFTALGQTFLIAQFIPHVAREFAWTRTEISVIYSFATFFSSFWLSYLGKLLDRLSLVRFSLGTVAFLALGIFILGSAQGIVTVFLGFFLIRTFGQITLGMIATTTVSRIYGRLRGKVLALTGQGRSVGEGFFPIFVVNLIAWWGWRSGLTALGVFLMALMIPMSLILLPRFPKQPLYPENKKIDLNSRVEHTSWGWRYLWLEKKALFVMVINATIPFIFTGIFFQQAAIEAYKGWSSVLIGSAFISYSATKFISSFIWGALIDRYSARVMQLFQFVPLVASILVLIFFRSPLACFIYMGLLGSAMGLYALVRNSYWAEVYGLKILGEIKGMDSALLVLGTSIAPVFFSFLLDQGYQLTTIFYLMVLLSSLGAISYLFIFFAGKLSTYFKG